MKARHVLRIAAGVPVAVLIAACGDDGGGNSSSEADLSEDERAYADRLAEVADFDGIEGEDADCLGDAVVVLVGVDAFEAADIQPDDIGPDFDLSEVWEPAEDNLDEFISTLDSCDLVNRLAAEFVDAVSRAPEGLTNADRECIAGEFDDGTAEEMLRFFFGSEDASLYDGEGGPLLGAATNALRACDVETLQGG